MPACLGREAAAPAAQVAAAAVKCSGPQRVLLHQMALLCAGGHPLQRRGRAKQYDPGQTERYDCEVQELVGDDTLLAVAPVVSE